MGRNQYEIVGKSAVNDRVKITTESRMSIEIDGLETIEVICYRYDKEIDRKKRDVIA